MRAEADIRRAINHVVQAALAPEAEADVVNGRLAYLSIADALAWALGEDTPFAQVVTLCDELDAREWHEKVN